MNEQKDTTELQIRESLKIPMFNTHDGACL